MNTADTAIPEMFHRVIPGHQDAKATIGNCASAVNGVKMNPMAETCGSRLSNTACAAEVRDSASPSM